MYVRVKSMVGFMSEEHEMSEVRKPGAGISLLFSIVPRGPPGLTSPSDERITINSTHAFSSYALQRKLRLNPSKFGTVLGKIYFILKNPSLPRIKPETVTAADINL